MRQSLKSSQEETWLRFFALMGTYIAHREKTTPVPNTLTNLTELRAELAEQESKLLGALRLSSDRAFFVSSYFLSEFHAFFATLDDERIVFPQC
jgi:hypothetical protein